MASWAVKECRYKYMPKSGSSDVQATPIIGYLKRKQPTSTPLLGFLKKGTFKPLLLTRLEKEKNTEVSYISSHFE